MISVLCMSLAVLATAAMQCNGRAAHLGPVVSDVHGERFEGLHILVWLHWQFALLADFCNVACCLLQLAQRL